MAAKLVLSIDGVVINECPLTKERVTIGRKAHNDVVINNLAVSGVHAAIITIQNDSFLEDLDSTNGLTVNGEPTKKYFLKNNDVIEIGKYKLKYLNDQVSQTNATDFEKTVMVRTAATPVQPVDDQSGDTGHFRTIQVNQNAGSVRATYEKALSTGPLAIPLPAVKIAAIQIFNGPNAGKELDLVKNLTTLGKPGVQVAVLTRRPNGFFITHVEGAVFPLVNGHILGAQPYQLNDHDVIELAGTKMEFYFKG